MRIDGKTGKRLDGRGKLVEGNIEIKKTMKEIIRYQTDDGSIFDNCEETRRYEDECFCLKQIEHNYLGGVLPTSKGWVQHTKENYESALLKTWKLFLKNHVDKNSNDSLYNALIGNPLSVHPRGVMGRIVNDMDHKAFNHMVYRLSCFDESYREHNQPYFAVNGPNRDHKCIFDRS